MITGVSKAVVLVDDQHEARAVWPGQAGVDATTKGPGGEERWIEVTPPARSLSRVLVVEVRGRRRQRPSTGWASRTADHRDLLWAHHRHPGLDNRPAPRRRPHQVAAAGPAGLAHPRP